MLTPKLILPKGEQLLTEPEYTIGRNRKCNVPFHDDPSLSRYHATIFKEDGIYYIKDGTIGGFEKGKIAEAVRSHNGTFLNGKKLGSDTDWKARLNHEDKITVGTVILIYWFPIVESLKIDDGKETVT